ncbi:MAG: helix-turn-helix domain-containing protein [Advenella sp.]|uniref:transcriptional regulator n=1 Tax=Advenella sp. TaxID=1872388 RepID=UPI00258FB138|nr:helix-turn-helix domain-containing protein [Advenella sp.]MDD3757685.1 helix-turn-helix domain-containing protein [Advenella sp.]
MQLLEYVNKKYGDRARLARSLGVSSVMLSLWARNKRPVPPGRCPDIERFTNGQVTCEELRPDVNWSVLRNNQDCTDA